MHERTTNDGSGAPDGGRRRLFDAAGRLLMVHQHYGAQRWDFPGGAAEIGESPAETAIRETREEIGITVTPEGLIGMYFTRRESLLVFVFRATYHDDPLALQAEELDDARWCLPTDLPSLTVWKRQQVTDVFAWTGAAFMRTRD